MKISSRNLFTTIKTEGALIPADLLERLSASDKSLEGLSLESYHLNPNERINEAASRSWNRLVNAWQSFQVAAQALPETDRGTTITRERWLLVLFQELGYGRLEAVKSFEIAGKQYPISHLYKNSPIHLVGLKIDIDRRSAGVAGAAKTSPHSLVQDCLNSSEIYLWGFVSNGLSLRILRDNKSLTRQAYVEFDLQAMMEGQVYSDFVILWLLCHQSRVEADKSEECWLERWSQIARDQGARALDKLRDGVENAIKILGSGFLLHSANSVLRDNLRSGKLSTQDLYRQLLRLVYRLIFLFVAEDRDVLLTPQSTLETKEFYNKYYSLSRLRRLAERMRGTKHGDLYQNLRFVMKKVNNGHGCDALGLPVLGSFLWSEKAMPDLEQCEVSNEVLLETIRSLTLIVEGKVLRGVNYLNLGSEELGGIYESLLELRPEINLDAATFNLTVLEGHERKTTGSYYTHTSLISSLLDSALEPVVAKLLRKENAEKALLSLKICDPACGSGHFLIAAAHRVAKRLAAIRTGDDEPSPEAVRKALRDVIGHCVYGVDINPMAVELCKVALWMEALEPGKPLSFLDHRIQCGNSLLGATPRLIKEGIPDSTFEPIEGDDKKYCQQYKKRNKSERQGQKTLFDGALRPWEQLGNLASAMVNLETIEDDTIEGIRLKQQKYEEFVKSSSYFHGRFLADARCAAFVWKKVESQDLPYPITEEVFRNIERNPFSVPGWLKDEVIRLSKRFKFFHWHIMFPDVFRAVRDGEEPENSHTGWSGGFDIVLGNPPWEKIKIMEVEFFALRDSTIALAQTKSERTHAIANLIQTNPSLLDSYNAAMREVEGEGHLVKNSGYYKHCITGELNTFAIFCELSLNIISKEAYCGLILKSTIATGDTYSEFFQLLSQKHLISFYDFKNWALYFPNVGFHERYALVTLAGSKDSSVPMKFGFQFVRVEELNNPDKVYALTQGDLSLFSPNSGTCPLFTDVRQKTIANKIYNKFPVLVQESTDSNPWLLKYATLFHMSGDSGLFLDIEQLAQLNCDFKGGKFIGPEAVYLPLYEGKYIQQYDYRFATYGGIPPGERYTRKAATLSPSQLQKNDPNYEIEVRYWVKEKDYLDAIERSASLKKHYICARLVTNVISNMRSVISCIIPAYPCNNLALILDIQVDDSKEYATKSLLLTSILNSFIFDFTTRMKMSENLLKSTLWEIAAPTPNDMQAMFLGAKFSEFCLPRSLELNYVTHALSGIAENLGLSISPFKWDEERRFLLRCELDAAFFHLYQIAREDIDYIMDTFPILKRRDEEKYGEYRTKRFILEIYDEVSEAMRTGRPYQTRLDPPPADLRIAHSK